LVQPWMFFGSWVRRNLTDPSCAAAVSDSSERPISGSNRPATVGVMVSLRVDAPDAYPVG
jgi:hypothetical protein